MLIALLILQVSYTGIKKDYYTKNSAQIASIEVESLSFEGDSLYRSMARIGRANYKEKDFLRAYNIVDSIPLDKVVSNGLYWDTQSLKALLLYKLHRYNEADSLFTYLDNIPDEYSAIKYRAYINYSAMNKAMLDYTSYIDNINKAYKYADTQRSKDKVLRSLARMYINVEKDIVKAKEVLREHTPIEDIQDEETKIGLLQIQGRLQMLTKDFKESKESYLEASSLAQTHGFVLMLDAIQEGYFRLQFSEMEYKRQQFVQYALVVLFLIVAVMTKFINYKENAKT